MLSFPIEFVLGPIRLNAHLVFEVLAFFFGFRYYIWRKGKTTDTISYDNRWWIVIGAAFGALVGSRLLGALESPPDFFSGARGWLYYYQSKTVVGALLGGLFGVELTKKILKETQSSGDLFTFPLILGMMIGRVGCLSAGVSEPTYGVPSTLPWAMDLGDGMLRHPTNLYEILFLGLLWITIHQLSQRVSLVSGSQFKLFMVSYLVFRFLIDFIKPVYEIPGIGLSSIQLACLLGLVYYYKVLIFPKSLIHA